VGHGGQVNGERIARDALRVVNEIEVRVAAADLGQIRREYLRVVCGARDGDGGRGREC
jgi:hypothetical protein